MFFRALPALLFGSRTTASLVGDCRHQSVYRETWPFMAVLMDMPLMTSGDVPADLDEKMREIPLSTDIPADCERPFAVSR